METYVFEDPDGYRSLPDELVLAIGRLVVIAGSLEGVAHGLIEALGVDDARDLSFESLMDRIKKRVRDAGVPECAEWEPDRLNDLIRQWCIRAKAAVRERNSMLHSYFFFRPGNADKMMVMREHIRPGVVRHVTMSDLESARLELERLNKWGNVLTIRLMHKFERGGRTNHYVAGVGGQQPPPGWHGNTDYFAWARSIYPRCPYNAGLPPPLQYQRIGSV